MTRFAMQFRVQEDGVLLRDCNYILTLMSDGKVLMVDGPSPHLAESGLTENAAVSLLVQTAH